MRWMIDGWVVTMPEGTVKGPEIGLPKNVINLQLTVTSQRSKKKSIQGLTVLLLAQLRQRTVDIFKRGGLSL